MPDEARRPIRAGQAFLDVIKGDHESQAALRRVQMRLQALVAAARPQNAASAEHPHVYHAMGVASAAMRGDFARLRVLVGDHPALKPPRSNWNRRCGRWRNSGGPTSPDCPGMSRR